MPKKLRFAVTDAEGLEELQRDYEPFRVALGLSISYQIVVEKHGGTMSCNSTRGQGTQFVLEIPVRQRPRLAA
jgi:[ribosomal protein S5]-alanine N-acetyltransferase